MTRGSNWLFLDLGRRIERAVHSAWLVRQMLSSQEDDIENIQYALEIADSAMTYRYRYLNVFQVPPAIDLLLLDPTNPRSAAFQIATILQPHPEDAQDHADPAQGICQGDGVRSPRSYHFHRSVRSRAL